jgi:hypothetical protein
MPKITNQSLKTNNMTLPSLSLISDISNITQNIPPINHPLPGGLDREKFCDDLQAFVSQAATGAIMAYIKGIGVPTNSTPFPAITNILSYFSKVYLNSCWHSYAKRDDKFVTDSFDKILCYRLIKGTTCLIHWIDKLCCTIFSLDITHHLIKDLGSFHDDSKREYILATMNAVSKTLLLSNKNSIHCVGNDCCGDYEEGVDFYTFNMTDANGEPCDDNSDDDLYDDKYDDID